MASMAYGCLEQYFKEKEANINKSINVEPLRKPKKEKDVLKRERQKTEDCNVQPAVRESKKKSKEKDTKLKPKRKKKTESSEKKVKEENATEKKVTGKSKEKGELDTSFKQSSITEHFKVRRSGRRCKSVLKNEEHDNIFQRILDEDESGLEVRVLPEKGRGVFATKDFKRGELICEYAGELINYEVGLERERSYAENPEFGCYSYFFKHQNKKYCVDATKESTRLGRLLNHSITNKNVCTKVFPIKGIPRLILVASRKIDTGEELVYDYGERNIGAIESHPWLKA